MSNIALSWAFKCHVGNASAKAVLVYLADRADDDGTAAYPKIATIVNVTELSERTVRTALKTLQERGFIRRGDQRYARLGKGGRNRLPQYCQIVWDLAVESDPSTLEWIKETHTAEHDPKTMDNTVDPAASTIMENGESKDVLPENAGTKPIPARSGGSPSISLRAHLHVTGGNIQRKRALPRGHSVGAKRAPLGSAPRPGGVPATSPVEGQRASRPFGFPERSTVPWRSTRCTCRT